MVVGVGGGDGGCGGGGGRTSALNSTIRTTVRNMSYLVPGIHEICTQYRQQYSHRHHPPPQESLASYERTDLFDKTSTGRIRSARRAVGMTTDFRL